MRALRKTTPLGACNERSARIVAQLEGMPLLQTGNVRSVALFWPMEARHEVDLRPLDALLRARGVSLWYPSVADSGMTFREVRDVTQMSAGSLGFAEPSADAREAQPEDLEVIVVPAVAIDPRGHRIGYGAGYYDRTLPRFPSAVTVGVAYDFQLVAEVPSVPDDVPVQWVVTDRRVLKSAP